MYAASAYSLSPASLGRRGKAPPAPLFTVPELPPAAPLFSPAPAPPPALPTSPSRRAWEQYGAPGAGVAEGAAPAAHAAVDSHSSRSLSDGYGSGSGRGESPATLPPLCGGGGAAAPGIPGLVIADETETEGESHAVSQRSSSVLDSETAYMTAASRAAATRRLRAASQRSGPVPPAGSLSARRAVLVGGSSTSRAAADAAQPSAQLARQRSSPALGAAGAASAAVAATAAVPRLAVAGQQRGGARSRSERVLQASPAAPAPSPGPPGQAVRRALSLRQGGRSTVAK